MMTKFFYLLLLLFFSIFSIGQTISLGSAINKAGKQRMICERMVKDYLLIGSETNVQEATIDLDNSMILFNENFHDLTLFAKYQDTKVALEQVNLLWADFRIRITNKPDANNALQIINDGLILVKACNLVSEKIQPFGEITNSDKLPNISGKERMNLQRIAKLYAIKNWGISNYDVDKKITETLGSFEICLSTLYNTKENTLQINNLLQNQVCELEDLRKLCEMNTRNSEFQSIIAKTNKMTIEFDIITNLYEKLVANKKSELEKSNIVGQN